MILLIIAFLSFLITFVTTPYLIGYLPKKDIVDKPGNYERGMHTFDHKLSDNYYFGNAISYGL